MRKYGLFCLADGSGPENDGFDAIPRVALPIFTSTDIRALVRAAAPLPEDGAPNKAVRQQGPERTAHRFQLSKRLVPDQSINESVPSIL